MRLPLNIPADHPAFAGHFPGNPIVPGVVLLDIAIATIEGAQGILVAGIAMSKFLSPAKPGEMLFVDFEQNADAVRFDILTADRKVASGRLVVAPSAAQSS